MTPIGDGEISFGGGQDVSDLVNTLEGAAVTAAAGAAAGGAAPVADTAVTAASTPSTGVAANVQPADPALAEQVSGMGR